MAVWIIIGICVVVALAVLWWRDRRHHGRIDQQRVTEGITKYWTDDLTMSRRDHHKG